MILGRVSAGLRRQDWMAIGIEFLIVLLGVFIGTQVSNWNEERVEKRETQRLVVELGPALQSFLDFFDSARSYYATTRAYSDTAFAGWRGDPRVSDDQFVIAAYQASQIYTFGINGSSWATIFGSDQLRNIDNPQLRRSLAFLMTYDYAQLEAALATRYREDVRQTIPEDIQDAIREKCGDREIPGVLGGLELPQTCHLTLPEGRFAAAAAALRAHGDLVGELRWHRAVVASYLANLQPIEEQSHEVLRLVQPEKGQVPRPA
jgi:hypothetical protein